MTKKDLRISNFNYNLPDERIAKHPLAQRDQCKLLIRDADGLLKETIFSQLPTNLPSDAMLVYNNTRVINARLHMHKDTGAAIEIFCLEPHKPADYAENFASIGSCQWLCFVGNSKRWKEGKLTMSVEIEGQKVEVSAERRQRVDNASIVEFSWTGPYTFASVIEAAGEIPIPPYLNRNTEETDSTDYQTIFSRIKGSVAAPTAGLHFTDKVLSDINDRDIPRRELTLHVGAGTFQPVKDDDVSQHTMHSEYISVPLDLIEELSATDRMAYAVGTTSVRTLESLYHIGCLISQGCWDGEVPQWYPYDENHPNLSVVQSLNLIIEYLKSHNLKKLVASTRIIIAPGYQYRIVKGMITNFHQPKSTLLLLVSAFIGDDWRKVYDYALDHDFRFLSYGDACLFHGRNLNSI